MNKYIIPIKGSKESIGKKIIKRITTHDNFYGGLHVRIYGNPDERLTLIQSLCQNMYSHNDKHEVVPETVIFRGSNISYWASFPTERTRIFVYNTDTLLFKNYNNTSHQIILYKNNKDLYSKLLRGGINVIYEPTTYTLTDRLKEMIRMRGVTKNDLFKNITIDSIIWWFEFIDWLRINKSLDHISIFINESDQLLPVSSSDVQWHLNLWFKDVMRTLRKRNISLFLACREYTDIDSRMKPKITCAIYMNGSYIPSESDIRLRPPRIVNLPKYEFYIETSYEGYSICKVNPVKLESNKITTIVIGSKGNGKSSQLIKDQVRLSKNNEDAK